MNRPTIFSFAAAALAALASCDRGKSNEFVPPPPPTVTVASPVTRSVTPYRVYSGTTEAFEVVEIRARVQGFLDKVQFGPGQIVKKGDLLFSIEKTEFIARVDQADAALASAKAALDLAVVTLQKSQYAFEQGGLTELEVKERVAARDQAKAAVDLADAKLDQAKLELSYCEILAPITGRISKNLVDEGNLVGQGETTLLATIYATDPIYVTVDAPEDVVLEFRRRFATLYDKGIQPGQDAEGKWRRVELSVSDEQNFPHVGRIDFVDPSLDPETGTLRVRVRFENADNFLIPGLFARVRIPGEPFEALLVPDASLPSDQQGRFAYVIGAENKVEVRRVQTGPLDGDLRVIRSGLTKDDSVIIQGLMRARPGAPVNPKLGTINTHETAADPDAATKG